MPAGNLKDFAAIFRYQSIQCHVFTPLNSCLREVVNHLAQSNKPPPKAWLWIPDSPDFHIGTLFVSANSFTCPAADGWVRISGFAFMGSPHGKTAASISTAGGEVNHNLGAGGL